MARLTYELETRTERIHGIPLEIECLADLDRTIDELFKVLEKTGEASLLEDLCPYFGTVWPSARALAAVLAELGPALKGRKVLELGCGLAIPSLIAAKLGAEVTATDFHPEVPIFLRRNLALNGIAELEYVRVDWRSEFPDLGHFDYVVGSDVLYERNHSANLMTVIARYLHEEGKALIADPARPYLQSFVDGMKEGGFACSIRTLIAPDTSARGSGSKDVFLLELQRT
jgi:predicted nicotinamide N-methyase